MFSSLRHSKPHASSKGFTLIEIILAASMITTFFVAISMYYKKMLDVSQDTTHHIQSGFLVEEGLEAVKLLRDKSWSANIAALSTTTTYYLYWTGTEWKSTTTAQKVENYFTRSFQIYDVTRDGLDNIASAGTLDTGTKKVVLSVAWLRKGSKTVATDTAETYITQLFAN